MAKVRLGDVLAKLDVAEWLARKKGLRLNIVEVNNQIEVAEGVEAGLFSPIC